MQPSLSEEANNRQRISRILIDREGPSNCTQERSIQAIVTDSEGLKLDLSILQEQFEENTKLLSIINCKKSRQKCFLCRTPRSVTRDTKRYYPLFPKKNLIKSYLHEHSWQLKETKIVLRDVYSDHSSPELHFPVVQFTLGVTLRPFPFHFTAP